MECMYHYMNGSVMYKKLTFANSPKHDYDSGVQFCIEEPKNIIIAVIQKKWPSEETPYFLLTPNSNRFGFIHRMYLLPFVLSCFYH